jgi:acetylglutamate/LysW-gamma-L-alpha-aminoadipate kinase
MKQEIIILKIGGGITINLEGIIKDLKSLEKKIIIVHGAIGVRNELANKTGYIKKTVESLSGYTSVISDKGLIELQMMAYAGVVNKRIVELCQIEGINAVGLSGIDGKVIEGRRNRGIKIKENGKKKIFRDFSGKPKKINTSLLDYFLTDGIIPVLTVPIIDEEGYAINSENDDIVALLQKTFKAKTVIHLIESKGFLKDENDQNSVIKDMSSAELNFWETEAKGRIKRKLLSLKSMFEHNIEKIIIADGRVDNPLKDALEGYGTVIR